MTMKMHPKRGWSGAIDSYRRRICKQGERKRRWERKKRKRREGGREGRKGKGKGRSGEKRQEKLEKKEGRVERRIGRRDERKERGSRGRSLKRDRQEAMPWKREGPARF